MPKKTLAFVNTESIYDLIPPPKQKKVRKPIYRSKFPSKLPPTSSTFGASETSQVLVTNAGGNFVNSQSRNHKRPFSTFGPGALPLSSFSTNQLNKTKIIKRKKKLKLKPPIPNQNDEPVHGLPTHKNFIVANAIQAMLSDSSSKKHKKACPLNYKHAEHGKVPEYLGAIKKIVQEESENHTSNIKKQNYKEYSTFDNAEKQTLLAALKDKHCEVMKSYQSMTHSLVFTSKTRNLKESYEKQLEQLEEDINKLSMDNVLLEI